MNKLKRVISSILLAISIMIVIFALIGIATGNVFLGVFFLIFALPLSLPFVIFELKKSKENEIKAVPQESVQNQTEVPKQEKEIETIPQETVQNQTEVPKQGKEIETVPQETVQNQTEVPKQDKEIETVPQETIQNQTISQNQENTGTEKSEKIRMIRQNLNRQPEIQKVTTTPSASTPKEEPKKIEIRKPDYIFDCQKLKYFYDDVKISAEKNLTVECKVNETLILSHEEDNEYDENAVAVLNGDRVKLGYLYKGKLQQMVLDFMEREDDIIARIASYKPQENEIIIALAFYRPIPKEEIVEKFRVSVSESKYSEFYYYMEGSQVNVMYDFDKDKYMIEEFAKLPERFEHYADNHDYIFVILDDKENDSGSHSIQIGIIER